MEVEVITNIDISYFVKQGKRGKGKGSGEGKGDMETQEADTVKGKAEENQEGTIGRITEEHTSEDDKSKNKSTSIKVRWN